MSTQIRNTPGPDAQLDLWRALLSLQAKLAFSVQGAPAIGNGTTAGYLRTTATTPFTIAGTIYSKASTDDLWDLSGETDTGAAVYRAYWLYLDSAGAASIVAGSDSVSAAAALAALPVPSDTLSIAGVYVAGPATDFDDAGGLAAQGTVYNSLPAGANIGVVGGKTYLAPASYSIVRS